MAVSTDAFMRLAKRRKRSLVMFLVGLAAAALLYFASASYSGTAAYSLSKSVSTSSLSDISSSYKDDYSDAMTSSAIAGTLAAASAVVSGVGLLMWVGSIVVADGIADLYDLTSGGDSKEA